MLNQITDDMKKAMKSGDKLALGVIRMLRAAIKDQEIAVGHTLETDEVIAMVGRLIKQRKEAAIQYQEADRQDLAEKELAEAAVLEVYLPEQMSEEEVREAIQQAVASTEATSMRDMGKVMAVVKPALQGRTDMSVVSNLVKQALQG
ncbi:MAG: glutamyl-tRNA amidotransferase [Zetaproteobacteria bacterium CG_4_9_14_3_um_filter_49_83]|nr:MAG: glutamyl-tRNA amidotransferase [Zetaproteobacteria bacterium CG1_02_49_23]PIQ34900.1 MAG: glutamyl-tRNA amidotransferase [Zetaproteobacteria bacterium CG17_big_fil_post_rev_8_21_14_2_50_50_13]PIV30923.1 MAG: glutamyl-tRNA amidotransferase [Zetaproteobacteria bacterium CG02_land_8_20_14_3_00_50_9]PIY55446.1 MAG: glutamyl-tRNA amidotransferase [Zetaproteobacteria bacterium CG_4_10_14_0_8_um_filter_49_80]PJA35185.1 MAG: glutamyl-tRNA amidotransferase [Zetaproteobacteria bacterium CG_4_9_14